ncbi:DnaJ domain-containing protein [Artemisia annua]|uniref:DnaJ domain-containing protein n=1 Tax=Artemisia annua TaxID=35608 RepID=A0A2U1LNM5_ARTAN|nr:DnaJ domain-containing protein [Artemisia annua]
MDNNRIDYNAIFNNNDHGPKTKPNNLPVYDIFDGFKSKSMSNSRNVGGFDELVHGIAANNTRSSSAATPNSTANTNADNNPFVVLESTSTAPNAYPSFSTDPLEEIPKFSESGIPKSGGSSVSGSVFDEIDLLESFSNMNNTKKNQSPSKENSGMSRDRSSISKDSTQKASFRYSERQPRDASVNGSQESHHTSVNQSTSPPSYTSEHVQPADEIWLTVSEIPLFTQPTRAPPPLRPPPPIPRNISKPARGSLRSSSSKFGNGLFSPNSPKYPQSPRSYQPAVNSPLSSPLDDLDNFSTNRMPNNSHAQSAEQRDSTLAAAAMKEAMDRAEAKFRHAKEVRERENVKASKNKESIQQDRDEHGIQERLRQHREKEEEEREQRRLNKERMREVERKRARQAVERATREARERASSEAHERQSAEARIKSEQAAFQRAQAEARERAAAGAKDRAERAADEVKEKAEAETRRRAERVALERVAEARKRAAADTQEKASAFRMNQQKNDNDLESFFSTSSRPNSAPRPRATSSDSASDPLSQNRRGTEGDHRTSTSNLRKASSTSNFVDDLSSIFGAAPTSAQFQEVEGESEERRKARLEREQRTQERAAKALDEKNQRDLQSQREQEERNRIGGTLDAEVKRWAAGKEGNLRALLSSLQYVLWPACGWQPVSLIDLITGANVKKAYRKATLCIHPDKVQQKGATLQQKYVAEKVFDILKEAWNKFNSEELF